MGADWDLLMFAGLYLGLFVLLPLGIFLAVRRLVPGRFGRIAINILGACGLALGLIMIAYPFVEQPTHPGSLAILILIPLGGLLSLTCALIVWFNSRKR